MTKSMVKITRTSKELIRRIQMIFQDPAASLNERANSWLSSLEGLTTTIYLKTKKKEKK